MSSDVIRFVRDTLGCGCPEEVFEHIEVDRDPGNGLARKVAVGGRLLVYVVNAAETPDLPRVVARALARGLDERERGGFSRLRLVVTRAGDETAASGARVAFDTHPRRDDRAHLHLLQASGGEAL